MEGGKSSALEIAKIGNYPITRKKSHYGVGIGRAASLKGWCAASYCHHSATWKGDAFFTYCVVSRQVDRQLFRVPVLISCYIFHAFHQTLHLQGFCFAVYLWEIKH